ncbi:cob(I)yrinic acid a,c-diamide adenosyltransferase [Proteinivorax hydrogeniformans]|uniref:Cob(I)yrinic acid a,c-diamide adenosyltransferase n=1 Tax=Proteinivorax hydrogeniformans TaxID=1826727 RepID=A0AAU8HVE2_9FIRM
MKKTYIQIYTGDGKGKTTAALGLGFRAAGRGLKVKMLQFLKGMHTGEEESIKRHDNFTLYPIAEANGLFWTLPKSEQIELKKKTQIQWSEFLEYLNSHPCDVLILDEIMAALYNGLISEQQVCDFLDKKDENMEVILTGRNAPKAIADRADLITEMKKVRHYYDKGVISREGIEK